MEKYSVLMSLYKKEKPEYFRAALESIIHQTVKPDEIVLVEDGPLTEELYLIIEEYKDSLHLVVNKQNLGLGLALNKGLKACKNELVARMDTDDIAVIDRCEIQLLFFEEHPNTTIVGGKIEEFVLDIKDIIGKRVVPETDEKLKEFLKKRCPFNHMTVMFKKTDVLNVGNYQDWFWNEDYYLWIRLALENYKFANLPDTLVYTRVGRDMYKRRGGLRYYKSEIKIQRFMLEKHIITRWIYFLNCSKRFIVQLILPNSIRGWVFKKFARS